MRHALLITTIVLAACGGRADPTEPSPAGRAEPTEARAADLPPVPYVDGPLDVRVVYPPAGARISVRDSTFIFGSTGTGDATLTINGATVEVARNGAFLAFLPVPADGV